MPRKAPAEVTTTPSHAQRRRLARAARIQAASDDGDEHASASATEASDGDTTTAASSDGDTGTTPARGVDVTAASTSSGPPPAGTSPRRRRRTRPRSDSSSEPSDDSDDSDSSDSDSSGYRLPRLAREPRKRATRHRSSARHKAKRVRHRRSTTSESDRSAESDSDRSGVTDDESSGTDASSDSDSDRSSGKKHRRRRRRKDSSTDASSDSDSDSSSSSRTRHRHGSGAHALPDPASDPDLGDRRRRHHKKRHHHGRERHRSSKRKREMDPDDWERLAKAFARIPVYDGKDSPAMFLFSIDSIRRAHKLRQLSASQQRAAVSAICARINTRAGSSLVDPVALSAARSIKSFCSKLAARYRSGSRGIARRLTRSLASGDLAGDDRATERAALARQLVADGLVPTDRVLKAYAVYIPAAFQHTALSEVRTGMTTQEAFKWIEDYDERVEAYLENVESFPQQPIARVAERRRSVDHRRESLPLVARASDRHRDSGSREGGNRPQGVFPPRQLHHSQATPASVSTFPPPYQPPNQSARFTPAAARAATNPAAHVAYAAYPDHDATQDDQAAAQQDEWSAQPPRSRRSFRANAAAVGDTANPYVAPSSLEFDSADGTRAIITCETLVDTGAQVSFISKSVVEDARIATTPLDETRILTGVTGGRTTITHRCLPIRIELAGVICEFQPFVAPLPHAVIFGSDALAAHELTVGLGAAGVTLTRAAGDSQKRDLVATAAVERHEQSPEDWLRANLPQHAILADAKNAWFKAPYSQYKASIKIKEGAKLPSTPRLRPMSPVDIKTIDEHVRELLEGNAIEACIPEFASLMFVAHEEGKSRVVIDSRALNDITVDQFYPLPHVPDLLLKAAGKRYLSTLDIKAAYHRIALDEESQRYSAFISHRGCFKFKVMSFGLKNAGAHFMHAITAVLSGTEEFTLVYLDDILVYSDTKEEHLEHLDAVLSRLKAARMPLSINKCQFAKSSVKYLGHIVSTEGRAPLLDRTTAIVNWPRPKTVKELQSFLGVANYYSMFIPDFAKMAAPLNDIVGKATKAAGKVIVWTPEGEAGFEELRKSFIAPAMLKPLDPLKPFVVECDASSRSIGAALMQEHPAPEGDIVLLPVIYFSKKLTNTESRYPAYDLELLALTGAIKAFQFPLLSSPFPFKVYTDHQALRYFTELRALSPRHWRLKLLMDKFRFTIVHVPGSKQVISDALSRAGFDEDKPDNRLILLDPSLFANPADLDAPASATAKLLEPALIRLIAEATAKDAETEALAQQSGYVKRNGLVVLVGEGAAGERIVVPTAARIAVIEAHHDHKAAGHRGATATRKAVALRFVFPRMRDMVRSFVDSCVPCQENKRSHARAAGLLQPLERPSGPWKDIHIDFFGPLPRSGDDYRYVMVVIDRYSRYTHFIPMRDITTDSLVEAFIHEVYRLHGPPSSITTDRGTQFTSDLWQGLMRASDIEARMTTAYHPEANGVCERANQHIILFLRAYLNGQQDNWYDLLPFCELAYNTAFHTAIGTSPFYLSHGYDADAQLVVSDRGVDARDISMHQLLDRIKSAQEAADVFNENARNVMTRAANRQRREPEELKPGDLVWIDRAQAHIGSSRQSDKLDHVSSGPYPVLERVSDVNYRVDLPPHWRMHNVFHVSKLRPFRENPYAERQQHAPRTSNEVGEHEVERILSHRKRAGRTEFFVKYAGYPNPSWQPERNLTNCEQVLAEYWLTVAPVSERAVETSQPRSNKWPSRSGVQYRR